MGLLLHFHITKTRQECLISYMSYLLNGRIESDLEHGVVLLLHTVFFSLHYHKSCEKQNKSGLNSPL